ncbi:hypothetical protein SSTU70S_05677 [Stutzerimonas stutzeri]
MTDTDQLKTMISGLATKTVYGQLEPLMPEIDRRIREGVPRAEIHKLITAQGIEISEGTFYNYLHRYRKRNAKTATPAKAVTKPILEQPQNGNSAPGQKETTPDTPLSVEVKDEAEPSLDEMLKSDQSREEFTNQFMTQRPIRRNKS